MTGPTASEPDAPNLPEQTTDDTDVGWGDDRASDDDDERRLLDERPPHHIDYD
jgi:hypothetical protein